MNNLHLWDESGKLYIVKISQQIGEKAYHSKAELIARYGAGYTTKKPANAQPRKNLTPDNKHPRNKVRLKNVDLSKIFVDRNS